MYKDEGLVLRSIPYSDTGRIIHCFTETKGLQALYMRVPKKRGLPGHLMPGSFISFAAKERPASSLLTISETRWDPQMPTDRLAPEKHVVWLFTLELLQKSLKEDFSIPQLLRRVRVYYALLSQDEISADPLIALITVSNALGLSDPAMVNRLADEETKAALQQLGLGHHETSPLDPATTSKKELFNLECDRFQQHFGIEHLESLYLFDL